MSARTQWGRVRLAPHHQKRADKGARELAQLVRSGHIDRATLEKRVDPVAAKALKILDSG